jgi:hypothetical protein
MSKRGVPKLGSSNVRGDHLVHVKVRCAGLRCAEKSFIACLLHRLV